VFGGMSMKLYIFAAFYALLYLAYFDKTLITSSYLNLLFLNLMTLANLARSQDIAKGAARIFALLFLLARI